MTSDWGLFTADEALPNEPLDPAEGWAYLTNKCFWFLLEGAEDPWVHLPFSEILKVKSKFVMFPSLRPVWICTNDGVLYRFMLRRSLVIHLRQLPELRR